MKIERVWGREHPEILVETKAVFTREEIQEKLGIDLKDFYGVRLHKFPENDQIEFSYLESAEEKA